MLSAGNRPVGLADKDFMPFTQAFLQEVQRLGATSTTSLAHLCSRDTVIQGHNIPAGRNCCHEIIVIETRQ